MYKTSLDPMNMISAKTGRMPHEITGWKTVPFPTLNEGHCTSSLGVSFLYLTQSQLSFLDSPLLDQMRPIMHHSAGGQFLVHQPFLLAMASHPA